MTQTRSCKDPAGAQEELTEAPCMLWVCYKAAGLGSHGVRVQMCSPAPCSQQEGHQTLGLPLLHPDFQMAHVGPKGGWPRADTAAWPPLEHHSVTVLLCAQPCPQLQGEREEKLLSLQLCMGPLQSLLPACSRQSCSFLLHPEGGLSFAGIIDIDWFKGRDRARAL